MLIVYFLYFLLFLYGTLIHIADFYTAQNWWWKYEWTAQNGNKYQYRVEVKEGESVDLQALFKEIHPNGTYQGWYKVFGDEQSKVDDVYTPNGTEEILYGKFGYVITFMSDGKVHQTLYTTTGAKGNQLANLGKNPTLGTYTFRDWYTGQNGTGTKITTSYQFNGNTTVYAKWVSVITYNNNGAGNKPANRDVIKGQQITSAGLPTLTGNPYTWKGWCATNPTSSGTAVLQASWVPTGNTTIYAKWVSVITYNNNGAGAATPNVEVLKGQQIGSGNIPTLSSDYTRKGWCSSNPTSTSTSVLTSTWIPTGNATIYAKWVSIVIFNLAKAVTPYEQGNNGWRPQAPIEVLKGQSVLGIFAYPENTTYDGWYSWWDSYRTDWSTGSGSFGGGDRWMGTGNLICKRYGGIWERFVPTGNINLYPGR